MSPCARWVSRMRFQPAIWACCTHRVCPPRNNWNSAPNHCARGARTPPCTYGKNTRRNRMTNYTYMESPVGRLLLAADEEGLLRVAFAEGPKAMQPEPGWNHSARPLQPAVDQLTAYFAGDLRAFDLPLHMQGTPF